MENKDIEMTAMKIKIEENPLFYYELHFVDCPLTSCAFCF